MRKLDNPIITGYEFHVINLVSYTCPKHLILPYLRETLEELKKRKPDKKGHRRTGRLRPLLLRLHARTRGHRTQR